MSASTGRGTASSSAASAALLGALHNCLAVTPASVKSRADTLKECHADDNIIFGLRSLLQARGVRRREVVVQILHALPVLVGAKMSVADVFATRHAIPSRIIIAEVAAECESSRRPPFVWWRFALDDLLVWKHVHATP